MEKDKARSTTLARSPDFQSGGAGAAPARATKDCSGGFPLFVAHPINDTSIQFWSCMKCETSYLVHNGTLIHFELSVLQGAVMGSLQCPHPGCGCSLFAIHKIWDTVNNQELPQLEFWNCLKCAKRLVKDGETLIDVDAWLSRI